jgi:hypothetical protein
MSPDVSDQTNCIVEFQSKLITDLGKVDFGSSAQSFFVHVNDHLFLLARTVRHLELNLVVGTQFYLHLYSDVPQGHLKVFSFENGFDKPQAVR